MIPKFLLCMRRIAFGRPAMRCVYVGAHELRAWDYEDRGVNHFGPSTLKNDAHNHPELWAEQIAQALAQLPSAKTKRVQILLDPELTLTQRIEILPQMPWKQAVGIAIARERMGSQLWAAWRCDSEPDAAWVLRTHQLLITHLLRACNGHRVKVYSIQSASWAWMRAILECSHQAKKPFILIVHLNSTVQCLFWDHGRIAHIITLQESDFDATAQHHEITRLQTVWKDFLHRAQTQAGTPTIYYAGAQEGLQHLQDRWAKAVQQPCLFKEAPEYPSESAFYPQPCKPHAELLPPDALKARRQQAYMRPIKIGLATIASLSLAASLYWQYEAWRIACATYTLEAHIEPWVKSDACIREALQLWEQQHAALTQAEQSQAYRFWLVQFFATLQQTLCEHSRAWIERLEIVPKKNRSGLLNCSLQIVGLKENSQDKSLELETIQHKLNGLKGLQGRVRCSPSSRSQAQKNSIYLNFKLRLTDVGSAYASN